MQTKETTTSQQTTHRVTKFDQVRSVLRNLEGSANNFKSSNTASESRIPLGHSSQPLQDSVSAPKRYFSKNYIQFLLVSKNLILLNKTLPIELSYPLSIGLLDYFTVYFFTFFERQKRSEEYLLQYLQAFLCASRKTRFCQKNPSKLGMDFRTKKACIGAEKYLREASREKNWAVAVGMRISYF